MNTKKSNSYYSANYKNIQCLCNLAIKVIARVDNMLNAITSILYNNNNYMQLILMFPAIILHLLTLMLPKIQWSQHLLYGLLGLGASGSTIINVYNES